MPVKSKAQMRLMEAIAHGAKLKSKPSGLTKEVATEFVKATPDYKSLPERKNKFTKLSKYLK